MTVDTDRLRLFYLTKLTEDYPKPIMEDLFSRDEFAEAFKLRTKAYHVGGLNLEVSGQVLLDAVRTRLQPGSGDVSLTDDDGVVWSLVVTDAAAASLSFKSAERTETAIGFWVYSPARDVRLQGIDDVHRELCFPETMRLKWRSILETRPLDDDEMFAFYADVQNLVETVRSHIEAEAAKGTISILTSIPANPSYFQELVGRGESGDTLPAFVDRELGGLFNNLLAWNFRRGLLRALSLCAHGSITDKIDLGNQSSDDIVEAFREVVKSNNPVCKVAAFELGLSKLSQYPELNDTLEALVKQIRALDVSDNSDLAGYVALFEFVEAELGTKGTIKDAPPFYRRLASLAQAGVIASTVNWQSFSAEKFGEYVRNGSAFRYYIQTYCDLRQEPRWLPDMIQPRQLKNEMLGRVALAAARADSVSMNDDLRSLLFDYRDENLSALMKSLQPFWPGPMEGALIAKRECTPEIADIIDAALVRDEVDVNSFVPIINASQIFTLDDRLTSLVSTALKRARYFVKSDNGLEANSFLLQGLAQMASTQRNPALAEDLFVLVRYMSSRRETVSLGALIMAGLTAAAAYPDFSPWADYLGRWLTELAFTDHSEQDARQLYLQIGALIDAEHGLRVTLAKPRAAALAQVQLFDPNYY